MPKFTLDQTSERQRHALSTALDNGALQFVRPMLRSLSPGEIGNLLESLPPSERRIAWDLVEPELEGQVLAEVSDEVRSSLIEYTSPDDLTAAAESLDLDDLADIIKDLPSTVTQRVLSSMDEQDRERLDSVLAYDEDTAGGLMNPDTVTIRPDVSVYVVQRYLRLRGKLPANSDALIVVDRYDHYLGQIPLSDLLTNSRSRRVSDLIHDDDPIPVDMMDSDVARVFEDRDLISAAVVDKRNRLLGRITIDDVVDVIREEGENSLLRTAGLDEADDMFAPILPSSKRRAVWLGVNLLTAFLAAWVIGLFESTIQQVVALAVLMPVVASMGGVAGSQTLTLVIRGMAIGQIGHSNARYLLFKEAAIAAVNGMIWSIVVASVAVFWFDNVRLGIVIAAAMLINLLAAATAGVSVPLILRRLGIDPALAGGVILTTITDVVGFGAFLGLGSWLLL